MFLLALPALGSILETVVTVIVTTVVSEMARDAYHSMTSNNDQD